MHRHVIFAVTGLSCRRHVLLAILCLCGAASAATAADKRGSSTAREEQAAALPHLPQNVETTDAPDSFASETGTMPAPVDKYMSGIEEGKQQKFEPFTDGYGEPEEGAPRRRGFRFWRRSRNSEQDQPEDRAPAGQTTYADGEDASGGEPPAIAAASPAQPPARMRSEPEEPPAPARMDLGEAPGLETWQAQSPAPPTRAEVEQYRIRLESRLLERYNNLPDHAGNVAKVTVVLSKPLAESLDGSRIRAEFDQLVYDPWGKRIPALEKEYYVVTFGEGGAQQVRSDPSIRVGLDLEKTYSEAAPLAADPFRNVQESDAFRPAPTVKMPAWWRPEYPELD